MRSFVRSLCRFAWVRALWGRLWPVGVVYRVWPLHRPTFDRLRCACCGATTSGLKEFQPGYCSACRAHQARHNTLLLAAVLASFLGGSVCAVTLPLLWLSASATAAVITTATVASLPLLLAVLCGGKPNSPHTALNAAVWQVSPDTFVCTQRRFARLVARTSPLPQTRVTAMRTRLTRGRAWLLSGVLVSTALSLWAHSFFHPVLRVLNLSDQALEFRVDSQHKVTLPPTSFESPLAGVELRIAAGEHLLSVLDLTGGALLQHSVRLVAQRVHLYAPLRAGRCFWLETTHYGRLGTEVIRQPLPADVDFWLLPDGVDLWFTPAPPSSPSARLSGGKVTALRQGQCEGPALPQ